MCLRWAKGGGECVSVCIGGDVYVCRDCEVIPMAGERVTTYV